MTKEKRKALFSIHTGMLSGRERKLSFLGAAGPPDAVQAEKPRGRILPSRPYLLLHKELAGEEITLFSRHQPWLFAHMAQEG